MVFPFCGEWSSSHVEVGFSGEREPTQLAGCCRHRVNDFTSPHRALTQFRSNSKFSDTVHYKPSTIRGNRHQVTSTFSIRPNHFSSNAASLRPRAGRTVLSRSSLHQRHPRAVLRRSDLTHAPSPRCSRTCWLFASGSRRCSLRCSSRSARSSHPGHRSTLRRGRSDHHSRISPTSSMSAATAWRTAGHPSLNSITARVFSTSSNDTILAGVGPFNDPQWIRQADDRYAQQHDHVEERDQRVRLIPQHREFGSPRTTGAGGTVGSQHERGQECLAGGRKPRLAARIRAVRPTG